MQSDAHEAMCALRARRAGVTCDTVCITQTMAAQCAAVKHSAPRSVWFPKRFKSGCRQELQRGDAVRIRMSTNPVPTISKTDQTRDWFGSLERCFGWNDRAEQKPLGYIDRGS